MADGPPPLPGVRDRAGREGLRGRRCPRHPVIHLAQSQDKPHIF
ncbi:MAG: hypothetical protein OXC06_04585 [Acidimicrobiaceae bacterium]|nr:hypothetical protein [Acidimicrobiaceae bacterium]